MANNHKDQTALVRRPETAPSTRWHSPVDSIFDAFRRDFDRMMGGFFDMPSRSFQAEPATVGGIDVYETDEHLKVSLDLPGMAQSDISLTVNAETLTVKGERRSEESDENARYHWRGSSYGSFERTIRLPAEVDSENAKAVMKNGVLTVTLPKVQSSRPRPIEIEQQ